MRNKVEFITALGDSARAAYRSAAPREQRGYYGPRYSSDLAKPAPKCKHCGSTDVDWVHTGVRWRIYDKDMQNPHRCARVADNNDFEDVSNA